MANKREDETDMARLDTYRNVDSDGMESVTTDEPQQQSSRIININAPQTVKFCNNRVSTAKYSFLLFLPKFLMEQFRRYANLFFLFISLLQQIPNVSPTGRFTTAVPLIFIFLVSAIKEIIEDFKRHRADDRVNNSEVLVLRHGEWVTLKWLQVAVGDIVKITNGQFFPADLVLLSSSEPQAMCYIETSNLDGETNLKIRQGLTQTSGLLTHDDLLELRGTVECEQPNTRLYDFVGNIRPSSRLAFPLGPDQLLLRGAMLRNTQWVFALAVYTGRESKLMLNSTSTPLKRSSVERVTNIQIIILFVVLIALSLISTIAGSVWMSQFEDTAWYLGFQDLEPTNFGLNFLTFIILYNNLIPISLQVTLEVVKFIQAIFINWDLDMYYAETDTPAMARTSNLNEELGQVRYIFSDKTGTLTRNIMVFKRCTIGGVKYGSDSSSNFDHKLLLDDLNNKSMNSEAIGQYLRLMAICHTVVPETNDSGTVQYQAASPDEGALVRAAAAMGFVFTLRTPETVTIEVFGKEERYEILNVLEFTSTRKRMSVVIRTPSGSIKILSKGADTVIYERLAENSQHKERTLDHLEEFASIGLRTLCLAVADVDPEFYEEWRHTFYKASTSIQNRNKKLEEAAELIERNFHLIGASAIEDKLQAGVPETIACLQRADMKVWVLTGDKQETAINIGYSCKLLAQGMPLIIVNEESLDATRETLRQHVLDFGEQLKKENDVALVINGQTLMYALTCDCRQNFLDVAVSCRSVIACRVSPLQKAELVHLVKKSVKAITLAIGDGANDVGMIQAAHVGIGISGLEGLQAACASDYAIGQFRFLKKLLLVHGAWSYSRLCKLILYSFYKNICIYLIEFWFAIVNGFSGQIAFERWTISLYNVIFTAVPPLTLGLFDRICSAKTMMRFPSLYKISQNAELFNTKVFWMWIVNSTYHSVLLFWLTVLALTQDAAFSTGQSGGYLFMGNMVYTYVIVTVCLKAGLETNAWTWLNHVSIWGSILSWFIFFAVYCHVYPGIPLGSEMVGMDKNVFSCGIFWMGLLLIPTAALLRDVTWKIIRRTLFKTTKEAVQDKELADEDPAMVINKTTRKKIYYRYPNKSYRRYALRLTETARLLRGVFTRGSYHMPASADAPQPFEQQPEHGYAFSQEEYGVVPQADVIRVYDTRVHKPQGL